MDARILNFAGMAIYAALAATAIYGLFVVVLLYRRVMQKRFSSEAQADEFMSATMGDAARRDYAAIAERCDTPTYWSKATPQLVQIAVEKRDLPLPRLRRAVTERFERDVLNDLDYRTSWVSTIVKTAPMLGLLGTVTGMISAFKVIASAGKTGTDPTLLASDISLALSTTAIGLTIAIPMVLAGNLLQNRISKLQDAVEERMAQFLDVLTDAEGRA